MSDGLHVCENCSGTMCYPLDWQKIREGQRELLLRCPECEHRRVGVFAQAVVERFDDEIDRASSVVLRELRQITRANMSEEADALLAALAADAILPEDFA